MSPDLLEGFFRDHAEAALACHGDGVEVILALPVSLKVQRLPEAIYSIVPSLFEDAHVRQELIPRAHLFTVEGRGQSEVLHCLVSRLTPTALLDGGLTVGGALVQRRRDRVAHNAALESEAAAEEIFVQAGLEGALEASLFAVFALRVVDL